MTPLRLFLILAAGTPSLRADDVETLLNAKDFWPTSGQRDGRVWSDAEQTRLRELKTAGTTATVQLRASKVLADLTAKARLVALKPDPADEPIAIAGFQYLEAHLADASVAKLIKAGITDYRVSTNTTTQTTWILIESIGTESGASGGLNLRWDADKKTVTESTAWGRAK